MYHSQLLIGLLSGFVCGFLPVVAQLAPSKTVDQTQCTIHNHADVTIEYGVMQMNGRKIFGGIVPYGKLWQTGEKQPPTIATSANLVIGGRDLPAGHYSLLTIPYPDRWTLLVKQISGKGNSNQVGDEVSIDLLVRSLRQPLESFTISLDQLRGGCVLNLRWEQTEASVLLAEKK